MQYNEQMGVRITNTSVTLQMSVESESSVYSPIQAAFY
jgi:hypothetical protein